MLLRGLPPGERADVANDFAARLCEDDVRRNRRIGEHGLGMFREIAGGRARHLNVMTHCNAGWLATVDWGTATAPMYLAHDKGLRVHVWVRETRPRFQGAGLTSWELGQHGVPHTLVSDSAAGHLLSRGKVDVVIVGTDRTTAAGDVANKVGTYPLALTARGQRGPVLRGGAVAEHRLGDRGRGEYPDRGARSGRGHPRVGCGRGRAWSAACGWCRRGRGRPTTPST